MLTLTVCFRNVLPDVPPEHNQTKNGDSFTQSRLGAFGDACFLDDIAPAAYRTHSGGLWSMRDEQSRRASQVQTFFWLAKYHERTGRPDLSAFFLARAIRMLAATLPGLTVPAWLSINRTLAAGFVKGVRRHLVGRTARSGSQDRETPHVGENAS